MMTSKERAEFRAQANTLDVTLIVGKGGISDTLLDEAVVLLDSHELVKGRVLETSGLTAREASDAICEALGAEGIACVGTKFVIWRKSEKVEQEKKKAASKKPAKKVSGNYNPVKAGLRARKQAAEQRPGCADDDIERGDGRKNVGDQAAERQADGQTRLQHDEHTQRVCNTELDISVSKRGGQDRDSCVESGNDAVQRDLAGGEFFHGLSSFCKPRRLEG